MFKITYYNRDKRAGNYSIEELFINIRKEIELVAETSDYYYEPKRGRIKSIIHARKFQGDINHITGDVNFLSLGLDGKKTLLTVHDIGYFENPIHNSVKKFIYKHFWLSFPFKKVAYITTVSEFTKNKILEYFPINPEKIRVIYNPCNTLFRFTEKKFNAEKPNILLIGTGAHKNFERLFEAAKDISCKLTIIGKLNSSQKTFLEKNKIEYVNYYNLTIDEVYKNYIECDLLFFASLYEGFGVPIIEANLVGRPVITSKTASMPEIAGDASILVDPTSVDEIRDSILKIINDGELRAQLIQKGLKNAERFSREKIIQDYINLYMEIYHKH